MPGALASVTGASARLNPLEILFVRAVPQRLDAKRYSDRSARRISTRDARVAGMSDAAVAPADEYDRGAHQRQRAGNWTVQSTASATRTGA